MNEKRHYKRGIMAGVLSILLAVSFVYDGGSLAAEAKAPKLLTLAMAKAAAVTNSSAIEKIESQIATKEVSLKQAIKSIQLKKQNMSTFRWSPLLSFSFPTKPDMAEAYEFEYKPLSIQSEIDILKHKRTDQVLAEYEKVNTLYADIIVYEQKIAFLEERMEVLEDTLQKNKARLKLGEAMQSDIDNMEKSLKSLTSQTASAKNGLESAKKKLSQAVGFDVSSGYTFQNPFVEAKIERTRLGGLIQYTLDRDESYYEVSQTAAMARISLETNYRLMKNHYGTQYMSYLTSYYNQAMNGEKISSKTFKKDYDTFLGKIDEPWQGSKRIWFVRIPKVWFKGAIDGIRYVEDEPYALYEATLEYQDARLEKESAKEDLTRQVEDAFENYISIYNSYQSVQEQVKDAQQSLTRDAALNRLGELTYEEYASSQADYEDLQNEQFETLALYTQTLYSFDRLTCGGISALLSGAGVDLNAVDGGMSYVEEELIEGAYYYIRPIVQEEEFQLGVSIPDDFGADITDFELWCDNTQIGERTSIDNCIRHLMLAVESVTEVKLRFYNGDTFVDDCIIDPKVYSGSLKITAGYTVNGEKTDTETEIGSYTILQNQITDMVSISLLPNASEAVGYYLIRTEDGKYLSADKPISIKTPFTYLSLFADSMEELVIEFYDTDQQLLSIGRFRTADKKLIKEEGGSE